MLLIVNMLFIVLKGTIIFLSGQFLYRIDEVLAHLGHRIFIDVGNVYAIIQKIGFLLKVLGVLTILLGLLSYLPGGSSPY
jgi:hypothetical protein